MPVAVTWYFFIDLQDEQIAKSIGVSLYLSNENDFQQSDFPLFSKEVIVPNCKRPGMSDALICQKNIKINLIIFLFL